MNDKNFAIFHSCPFCDPEKEKQMKEALARGEQVVMKLCDEHHPPTKEYKEKHNVSA